MYHLIFKTGEIKDISDEQGIMLINSWASGKENFALIGEKRMHSFSRVSDIRPAVADEYKQIEAPKPIIVTKEKYLKHLRDLRAGFLKNFIGKEIAVRSQNILNEIDRRLKIAESSPAESKFNEKITTCFGLNN